MTRRFGRPMRTVFGRIGHPGAIDRRLVRCAGVAFEDRQEGKLWTFRKYEAYGPDWPPMDVWTVRVLIPVKRQGRVSGEAYGIQTPVTAEAVPEEVVRFALAELVKMRMKGQVDG